MSLSLGLCGNRRGFRVLCRVCFKGVDGVSIAISGPSFEDGTFLAGGAWGLGFRV